MNDDVTGADQAERPAADTEQNQQDDGTQATEENEADDEGFAEDAE